MFELDTVCVFKLYQGKAVAMWTDGSYKGGFLRHFRLVRQCIISTLSVNVLTDNVEIAH